VTARTLHVYQVGPQDGVAMLAGVVLPKLPLPYELVGVWIAGPTASVDLVVRDGSGSTIFESKCDGVTVVSGFGFWQQTRLSLAANTDSVASLPPELVIDPTWTVTIYSAMAGGDVVGGVAMVLRGESLSGDIFRQLREAKRE